MRYRDAIVYSSFLWRELRKIRRANHRARIGVLWGEKAKLIPRWLVALIGKLVSAESIHIDLEMLTRGTVLYFRRKGFTIYAYSVGLIDPKDQIVRAAYYDVDGVFTDYPAYSREHLRKIIFQ